MIVYVLRYYPTLTETFVHREIEAHVQAGLDVCVLALGQRDDGAVQDLLPDVPVLRLPHGLATLATLPSAANLTRAPLRRLAAQQGQKSALRCAWALTRLRNARRVHAHFAGEAAEVAWCLAELLGCPLSVTCHAVDLFKPRPSVCELLRAANLVITIAEHHRRWIDERYGVHAVVVRNGAPMHVPQATPDSPGPLRLVGVGRDVPKKGLDVLLRAMDHIDGVHLRWIGPTSRPCVGPIVGPLSPSQIPHELAEAHALVLPCVRADDGDMDGIPVVLVEAMAAGLPVITTDVSGIAELVDDTVGWLLPPDDVQALVDVIRHLQQNPDERAIRGAAGRARAHRNLDYIEQAKTLRQLWDM